MAQALEKEIRIPKSFGVIEVRTETFNEEDRTFEVVFATATQVKRYSYDEGYYMEELVVDKKAVRTNRFDSMSFLDAHGSWSMDDRLGTIVPGSVRIEGGKAICRIKLSKKQRAEEIYQDLKDGHPLPVSVGYKIHRYEKTEGADGKLPVLRAVDWEPMEISAAPIPADPESYARSEPKGGDFEIVLVRQDSPNAADAATSQEKPMNKREAAKAYKGDQLEALALGAGVTRKENETDDALRARLLEAYDAEDKKVRDADEATKRAADEETARRAAADEATRAAGQQPATPPPQLTTADVAEAGRKAVIAERTRVNEINSMARTAGFQETEGFVRAAIDQGTDVDKFRTELFDKMVERQNSSQTFPHVETRGMQDAQETTRRMVANAILHRQGVVEKLEDGAREWRSMAAMDIAKELLRARGESTRGSLHDVAQRALHSTSDFPIILGDITRQTLLTAYARYENTFQLFATRTLLNDFRETKVLDIGSAPDLKKKNEHGEFTSGTVRESEEGMKLQSYGRKIGFTREMLINDQLNAFMSLVSNWGQKAAKLEGDIVWGAIIDNAKLKDGKGIFHADHGNLAGAGTALDKTNLIAARKALRKQKDLDGEAISVNPKYLFTGSDLEIDAQMLIAAAHTPANLTDTIPQAIKSLVPMYEYRLDKITTKAWFLFADAASTMGRGIHYLHLQGSEAPRTNERIGFDVEGVEYTIAHDFGVGLTDYRFAYKNVGV